jgi:hypothetical protein
MKLLIDDSEIEVKPVEIKTEDKGLVIISRVGERKEGRDELTKMIIAHDTINLGSSLAAKIHGVAESSASKYGSGLDIKDSVIRDGILAKRNGIADSAVSKLIESLSLFDPSEIEKPLDQIRAAQSLATIVEKMTPNSKQGDNEIHLHLYSPKQRPMKEYEVIDV